MREDTNEVSANEMLLIFESNPVNEGLARVTAASFCTQLNPTLEEIAEVMSKVSLGHIDAPCILYNLNGYYNSLRELLACMISKGLSTEERQKGIYFADNRWQIKAILQNR